jgi:hypothetical protein
MNNYRVDLGGKYVSMNNYRVVLRRCRALLFSVKHAVCCYAYLTSGEEITPARIPIDPE